MLRILRRGQRWILWFVIVVVGGAFVFFLGIGGAAGPATPAGRRGRGRRPPLLRPRRDRVRQRQVAEFRRTLGDAYNPETAARFPGRGGRPQSRATRAPRAGGGAIGLRVTDGEVRDYLRTIPGAADVPDGSTRT